MLLRERIISAIKTGPWTDMVNINCIVTQRCNLRCAHCNVKEWLTNTTEPTYPFEDLIAFCDKVGDGKRWRQATFIGGEALMVPERLNSIISALHDRGWYLMLTTNALSLPSDIDFLLKFNDIAVSVDGLPEDHDKQRGKGTFARTYRNVRKLVELGANVKILSCPPIEYDRKKTIKFYQAMYYAGVPENKVFIGSSVNGYEQRDMKPKKLEAESHSIKKWPCCEYRWMSNFSVTPDGDLWPGYFAVFDPEKRLGNLSTCMEDIEKRYTELINQAVFVKDDNCISCPALAGCWGLGCTNHFKYSKDTKPSELCDQGKMIDIVDNYKKGKDVPVSFKTSNIDHNGSLIEII